MMNYYNVAYSVSVLRYWRLKKQTDKSQKENFKETNVLSEDKYHNHVFR